MNESVEKFINFLEEKIFLAKNLMEKYEETRRKQSILNNSSIILKDMQRELKNLETLLAFLKMPKETIMKTHTVYKLFKYISNYLETDEFNVKEKMHIIFYVVQKNNLSFNINPNYIHEVLELNTFKKLYAPDMSMAKFEELAKKIDFVRIGGTYTKLLNKKEREINEKINEAIEITKRENKLFMLMHKYLQIHYFDKLNSYTEKDLKFINVALKKLNVSPKIIGSTIRILTKEMEKREQSEKNELQTEKSEKYDYKALEKEVSASIDLKDMFPLKPLSLEEKIYILSILIKMNVSKEERNLFLRNCEMVSKKTSPITKYLENYNRLKYYEESAGLQKEIAFMEDCFQEMMLCSDEDYLFWKESLQEALKQVEHWIPKNYEYEEEKASRLLKK